MLIVRELFGVSLVLVVVFVSAGRFDWLPGWLFVATYLGMIAAVSVYLRLRQPELLERRRRTQAGAPLWDRVLVGIYGLVAVPGCVVLAGLDERFGLGPAVPLPGIVIGEAAMVASGVLVIRSIVENPHFEAHVRLQEDRQHRVVDSGPYRVVRHPGYVGMIGVCVAIPLVLASWWALVPGLLGITLVVVRTALEDRFLRRELPGYAEYAERTRYRLLPPIW